MADPEVASIVAQLRAGGVYVAPSLSSEVTAADVSALRSTIARYPQRPTYVIASSNASTPSALVAAVQKQLGKNGVFFVSRRDGGSWDLQSVKVGVVTNGRDVQATFVAFDRHPRDLGAQLRMAVQTYASGSTTATSRATSTSSDSSGSSPVLWWSGAAGLLVIMAVLLAILVGRRRSGKGRRRAEPSRRASAGSGTRSPGNEGRGSHRR